LVRDLPIRWSDTGSGCAEDDAVARGWFEGVDECARILAACTALDVCGGGGFGGPWPVLRGEGVVVAPALPVVGNGGPEIGPDGEYGTDGADVWREAVGVKEPYLVANPSQPAPSAPFDLLWFGDAERFLIRDGLIEVEDLFGALRGPAHHRLVDRILARGARVDDRLLSSLPLPEVDAPAVIEVRRPAALSTGARWRDPALMLAARPDIEEAHRNGPEVEVRVVGDRTATFNLEENESGWKLKLRAGTYPLTGFELTLSSSALSLCATLDAGLDAFKPGMRGRLIFDLRADLVALEDRPA
jgi:hypothetical protein